MLCSYMQTAVGRCMMEANSSEKLFQIKVIKQLLYCCGDLNANGLLTIERVHVGSCAYI